MEDSLHTRIDVGLRSAGLALSSERVAQLGAYLSLLTKWNRTYNLTGLTDLDALIERHLLESLALQSRLRGSRIADLGSGAGLPGIPLAIAEPAREFTLIESRAKRVRFLRHVIAALPLANASVAHSRAEDLPSLRPFDTVLARAVAPPAKLVELVRPLTAVGSVLLLLTTRELGERFAALADGFAVATRHGSETLGLRSSIVMLERVA